MADHYADDMERQTEYRTKVKEASNLLLELVNDVLDMSKLESGEIVLEEIPFNLSSISREVFVVIEQMAAEQNIRVAWEKKEITHRDFIGSPGYVKRVMMNILSNAVKYNKENGQIYVSCVEIPSEQPEMTTMEFVCRDTGIGMAEEFQKHILNHLHRNIREVAQSLPEPDWEWLFQRSWSRKWAEPLLLKVKRRRVDICDPSSI